MRLVSTLRGRLLLVVGAALALLGAFAFLSRHRLTEQAQAEWRDDVVRLGETAAASHVETLRRTLWLLQALARVPEARDPAPDLCASLFGQFYQSPDYYTAFGIVDPGGMTVCTEPAGDPFDVSPRPYFQRALETRLPAISDYHVGEITGRPLVTLAVPVLAPDSSVATVLATGIDLSRLDPLPTGVGLPPGARLTLVDREGRILYRAPDTAAVPVDRIAPGLEALVRTARSDTVATLEQPGTGTRTYALAPLDFDGIPLGAHVIVSFDPTRVEERIAAASRSGVLGVALAGVLLLAGLWAGVELLVLQRIAPIVDAAERLGRGDLRARSGIDGGKDEISRLGRAFDAMAANLEAARTEERKQVVESQERLRLVAETLDEVFWIWDPGREAYVYLSPAFDEIWGIPRERLMEDVGVWTRSMHPDDREAMESRMIDAGTLREGEHEYRIVRPDGDVRWIASRTFAVRDDEGRPLQYLGVAQDVTDRKHLEDALLHATKLEAVGRLAGGIAHDFNNILTAIQGHTQFLRQTLGDRDELADDLDEIAAGVARAAGLTRQLLTFSRKQTVQTRILDLNQVVRDTARMLGRLIGEDVKLELDLAGDVPPVEADLHQVEQVVLNLAVNARDAMPRGGVLRISTGREVVEHAEALTADVVQRGEYAALRVEDDGTGMKPGILEHVFEPFFTTKPPGEGTGLGLATVYGVVKQTGGAVEVRSEPGRGTTFIVFLPAARREADERGETEPAAPPDTSGCRVLLVEDEESVRSVVTRILERLGCRVASVATAEEALDAVASGQRADVLVTDVVMPGMNGVELYRRLQDLDPDLPVVFMSGYPALGEDESALTEEHPFLQKPFTREDVARALDRALGG